MARRVRELKDLIIDEVSLVDKGANQYATVTIAKRDTEEEKMDEEYFNEDGDLVDLSELEDGDVVFDENGNAFQFDADDYDDVEKGFGEKIVVGGAKGAGYVVGGTKGAYGRVARGTKGAYGRVASGMKRGGGGVKAAGEEAVGAASEGMSRGKKIALGIGGTAAAGGLGAGGYYGYKRVKKSYSEEISKALSEAITDTERDEVIAKALGDMEYLEAIAKSAEHAAENERQMRLDREYTEIAKNYNVGIDPYVLGPVLKRAAESMTYEDCEVIAKALESASVAIDLLDEFGVPGLGSNSDVLASVDALLDAGVAKNYSGSREELVSKVFEDNPFAYDEYLAERRGY